MGKLFDLVLFFLILLSVVVVMLESVGHIDAKYHDLFLKIEWGITLFFTLEYILRIVSVKKPFRYIFSFYGLIDLLATIPLYLSYIFAGSQVLLAVRAFRLLRVFRILKLVKFLGEASQLSQALRASRAKILVFVYTVLILSVIMGTIMYQIEGEESGFTSIPRSIYWTIVTLTTVGYGDIAPQTTLGQFIATIIMVLGYGIIAVPTGIVTVEYAKHSGEKKRSSESYVHTNTQACPNCSVENHRDGAKYCYNCGDLL
jgi:voltage-gated potassium channel